MPFVVSNDPYFLDKEDWETHKILVAIGKNSTLSRLKPGEYATESAWLKSGEEMQALFPNHKDAIANTQKIADQCVADLDLGTWIMPHITVPGNDPNGHLAKLAYEGLTATLRQQRNVRTRKSRYRRWNSTSSKNSITRHTF